VTSGVLVLGDLDIAVRLRFVLDGEQRSEVGVGVDHEIAAVRAGRCGSGDAESGRQDHCERHTE
jgi:hypothetical protein